MTEIILNLIKGFVTKELLMVVFREVILETLLDVVQDFVAKSENKYDDALLENLRAYLENEPGVKG